MKRKGWSDKYDGRENPKRHRSTTLGVIVGRFQVPELHEAHLKLIKYVIGRHRSVLLFLCSKGGEVLSNPLSYDMREAMLRSYFPSLNIESLTDAPGDDKLWSRVLDTCIKQNLRIGQRPVLYGGRDSFIPYYSGVYKTEIIKAFPNSSGTDVRKLAANRIINSPDFRAGVIYTTYRLRGGDKR